MLETFHANVFKYIYEKSSPGSGGSNLEMNRKLLFKDSVPAGYRISCFLISMFAEY